MLKIIIHVILHYCEIQLYIVEKLSLVVFYNVTFLLVFTRDTTFLCPIPIS